MSLCNNGPANVSVLFLDYIVNKRLMLTRIINWYSVLSEPSLSAHAKNNDSFMYTYFCFQKLILVVLQYLI